MIGHEHVSTDPCSVFGSSFTKLKELILNRIVRQNLATPMRCRRYKIDWKRDE